MFAKALRRYIFSVKYSKLGLHDIKVQLEGSVKRVIGS